ncbi:MAG: SUMF1/EgtB/PvdO family nonheme iron enzyme [Proteobacteria bacterium]|nr:SUMF1/EgtB/PvdO family nonheme iron enzyme [Pseudomonadota bacterium]
MPDRSNLPANQRGSATSPTSDTIDGSFDNRGPESTRPRGGSGDRAPTAEQRHALAALGDRFAYIRLLGRGGMGQVYLARDGQLGRRVAIKRVAIVSSAEADDVATEARITARVADAHVVTVHDVVVDQDAVYIISEYIEGKSLDRLSKPVPWRRALDLALDLARGLAAAHECGVLHRDIKPGNAIWDDREQRAKLIDFGVATLRERAHGDKGRLSGTPLYLAPEIWQGQAASPQSDVYSFGVLVYEMCTGRKPAPVEDPEQRRVIRLEGGAIDRRFAAIVNRCLELAPSQRYASGQELADALARLRGAPDRPRNPYRGLLAFQAAHRHVFFGRSGDTERVVERMAARPLVLLMGNSGVGKSSLVHAGVLPRLHEDARAANRDLTELSLVPGQRPLVALTRLLAGSAGIDPNGVLIRARQGDFVALVRALYARLDGSDDAPDNTGDAERRLVIVVDQLEELVTVSDSDEAVLASALLAELVESRAAQVRVLAAARGDNVADLADLPRLGPLLQDSLYLVRSLDRGGIRQAIEQPAHTTGVRFESAALVDALVEATAAARGGLPLLQFALAQLWEARDRQHNVITHQALDDLGGVAGALARHAENVLAELTSPSQREAAQRIVVRLVTLDRTRARCTRDDLVAGQAVREQVLEHLVKCRLLVCHEVSGEWVYSLAHEALLTAWPTVRGWLDDADALRAAAAHLADSARDWQQVDGSARASDLLWSQRRLRQIQGINPGDLSSVEAAFVAASRRAVARARLWRWLGIAAVLAVVGAAALAVRWHGAAQRQQTRDRLSAQVDRRMASVNDELRSLRSQRDRFLRVRQRAMDALRASSTGNWRQPWRQAMQLEPQITADFRRIGQTLEAALGVDPSRRDVRDQVARFVDEHALIADLTGREAERDQLVSRLAAIDPDRAQRWRASVPVTIATEPAHAAIDIIRYETTADRRLRARSVIRTVAGSRQRPVSVELEPGSYAVVVAATGERVEVRYPFAIPLRASTESGQNIVVLQPRRSAVPAGFVYIPAGSFTYGYGRDQGHEGFRQWYGAPPRHVRTIDAYLIGRYEVTYAEWLEFAAACADAQCPGGAADGAEIHSDFGSMSLRLKNQPDIGWQLWWRPDGRHSGYRAEVGQHIVYQQRSHRSRQDWLRFPVAGVSWLAAEHYVRWLRRAKGIPGADLCTQEQWERAARGADGRLFPHGDRLEPNEANFDKTYGQNPLAFGPDEVGAHPLSASPFGVHDMAGNVFEMTRVAGARPGAAQPGEKRADTARSTVRIVHRGGSFYHALINSHTVNRWDSTAVDTWPYVGFRVCAAAP